MSVSSQRQVYSGSGGKRMQHTKLVLRQKLETFQPSVTQYELNRDFAV